MATITVMTSDMIIAISSIVQAITTVALVVITYFQMKIAENSIDSMERTLKADFLPVLQLAIAEYSSSDKVLNLILTNCGKGIAIKPRVIFPGRADIVTNSIDVKISENVSLEYSAEFILTKVPERERKITIEYHDVFNRKIRTEANLIEVNRFGPAGNEHGISWDTWAPIIP